MSRSLACVVLMALLAAGTWVAPTWAQKRGVYPEPSASPQRGRILLLVDRSERGLSDRVRAELVALGFDVRSSSGNDTPPTREALEDAARAVGAIAALRIRPSRAGVEVWLTDRVTGKTLLRDVVLPRAGAQHDDAIVAARAVELLRASLLELDEAHPPRGEVEPSDSLRDFVRKTDARQEAPTATLDLSGALVSSPGGIGPAAAVRGGGGYALSERWRLSLSALTTLMASRVSVPDGTAAPSICLFMLGTEAAVLSGSRLELRLRAEGGVHWLHVVGEGEEPNQGRRENAVAAAGAFGVAGVVHLGGAVRLRLDGSLGATAPRPVIRMLGREVASWGRPFTVLALGVEVALD
jgi:hypothetical protein